MTSPLRKEEKQFVLPDFSYGDYDETEVRYDVKYQKAKYLLLTSKRLNGEDAFKIGLADILTDKSLLMEKAIDLANEINTSGPLGIKSIRSTMNEGLADEIEKIVKIEANEQNKLRTTLDFKEGIRASIERREPNFIGK